MHFTPQGITTNNMTAVLDSATMMPEKHGGVERWSATSTLAVTSSAGIGATTQALARAKTDDTGTGEVAVREVRAFLREAREKLDASGVGLVEALRVLARGRAR